MSNTVQDLVEAAQINTSLARILGAQDMQTAVLKWAIAHRDRLPGDMKDSLLAAMQVVRDNEKAQT